jgi:hypothetical protein
MRERDKREKGRTAEAVSEYSRLCSIGEESPERVRGIESLLSFFLSAVAWRG